MTGMEDEARQEAERRWPSYPTVGFSGANDRQQAFIDGASWAFGQAEAIDRMGPAAGCAYCVGAGGYEDYDGEWRECSCQQVNREPSDAAVEAAARAMAHADVTNPDGWVMTEEARNVYSDMARAALIAAQEVRNRG